MVSKKSTKKCQIIKIQIIIQIAGGWGQGGNEEGKKKHSLRKSGSAVLWNKMKKSRKKQGFGEIEPAN